MSHETDSVPYFVSLIRGEGSAEDAPLTPFGLQQCCQHPEERGLAGTVGAEEPEGLPRAEPQIDVAEDRGGTDPDADPLEHRTRGSLGHAGKCTDAGALHTTEPGPIDLSISEYPWGY
jgi:hypothetical protein